MLDRGGLAHADLSPALRRRIVRRVAPVVERRLVVGGECVPPTITTGMSIARFVAGVLVVLPARVRVAGVGVVTRGDLRILHGDPTVPDLGVRHPTVVGSEVRPDDQGDNDEFLDSEFRQGDPATAASIRDRPDEERYEEQSENDHQTCPPNCEGAVPRQDLPYLGPGFITQNSRLVNV